MDTQRLRHRLPSDFRFPLSALLPLGWLLLGCLTIADARADELAVAGESAGAASAAPFPSELVDFSPYPRNPIFGPQGPSHWDVKIRERGWILREADSWRMWFTGYDGSRQGKKMLGLATSSDGLTWTPDPRNPIYSEHWCEDMMVLKHEGTYYLFAEGTGDRAELLESPDGVSWTRRDTLDVRNINGQPLSPGPFGTPTVWYESGVWYLYYERADQGVWLATSRDLAVWKNVQDEPVLARGPEEYDKHAVALNQVIRHGEYYYAYYHGSDTREWREWSVNIARSKDLVRWEKYSGNPLVAGNQSSGIVVPDGGKFRLYTMHDRVRAYLPKN